MIRDMASEYGAHRALTAKRREVGSRRIVRTQKSEHCFIQRLDPRTKLGGSSIKSNTVSFTAKHHTKTHTWDERLCCRHKPAATARLRTRAGQNRGTPRPPPPRTGLRSWDGQEGPTGIRRVCPAKWLWEEGTKVERKDGRQDREKGRSGGSEDGEKEGRVE